MRLCGLDDGLFGPRLRGVIVFAGRFNAKQGRAHSARGEAAEHLKNLPFLRKFPLNKDQNDHEQKGSREQHQKSSIYAGADLHLLQSSALLAAQISQAVTIVERTHAARPAFVRLQRYGLGSARQAAATMKQTSARHRRMRDQGAFMP
jgi:hypothetical protein